MLTHCVIISNNLNTKTMKKLIAVALLFVGLATFAQEQKVEKNKKEPNERLSPAERNQRELKRITKDLNLNETQQKQMAEIISDRETKKIDSKFKPSKEERIANKDRIKKILTPEQNEKWEKIQEERKGKMKDRKDKRIEEIKERRKEILEDK